MKLRIQCDCCGRQFEKYECRISKHNFCSRQCLANFSNKANNPNGYAALKDYSKMSKHLAALNRKLNPERMTPETREKIRRTRLGSGDSKTYEKTYGRHTHRVIAEQIIGRALNDDEVVHHLDGNPRNNDPDNLQVFPSQKEHAAIHAKLYAFFMRGGDAQ